LISTHLADGSPLAGAPITLKIDQTLTQDATGTLVMLTLEAIGLAWMTTEVSVQYVDHNLLQVDNLNADDAAASAFGTRAGCNAYLAIFAPPSDESRSRRGRNDRVYTVAVSGPTASSSPSCEACQPMTLAGVGWRSIPFRR
jgi:hypothetical protein